jgi:hypothetical protein
MRRAVLRRRSVIVAGRSVLPDSPENGDTRPSAKNERSMRESSRSDDDLLPFLLEQVQKLGEENLRVALTRFIQESLQARNRRPGGAGNPPPTPIQENFPGSQKLESDGLPPDRHSKELVST